MSMVVAMEANTAVTHPVLLLDFAELATLHRPDVLLYAADETGE